MFQGVLYRLRDGFYGFINDAGVALSQLRVQPQPLSKVAAGETRQYTLTPSDQVFFENAYVVEREVEHRCRIVREVFIDANALKEMLMAALLANEQAGTIRFTAAGVHVIRGDGTRNWPVASLEYDIYNLTSLQWPVRTSSIVYSWLGQDSTHPMSTGMGSIRQRLVQRGLLEIVQTKWLKFFTISLYVVPEGTTALLEQQKQKSVVELLPLWRQTCPEIWDGLTRRINEGISLRTLPSD